MSLLSRLINTLKPAVSWMSNSRSARKNPAKGVRQGQFEHSQMSYQMESQQQNSMFLDKIFKIQKVKQSIQSHNDRFIASLAAEGQSRKGFDEVKVQMQGLYDYICNEILEKEGEGIDEEFIQRSHYNLQNEGKKIRPIMVALMAKTLTSNEKAYAMVWPNILKWAAVIQAMHITSLAHDDIIDDSPSRRGVQSPHAKYGKRAAIISSNNLISKASFAIASFNSPLLYKIYSNSMYELAKGELIQMETKNKASTNQQELRQIIKIYMNKTYYKTAALMAHALRAVPILLDSSSRNFSVEVASFRVGQHFGIAFQLVDDIMDYTSSSQQMGKEQLSDLIQGNVTAPVYFALLQDIQSGKNNDHFLLVKKKQKDKQKVQMIKQWIMQGSGIELSMMLATLHIEAGLKQLEQMGCKDISSWKYLGHMFLTRRK